MLVSLVALGVDAETVLAQRPPFRFGACWSPCRGVDVEILEQNDLKFRQFDLKVDAGERGWSLDSVINRTE